MKVGGANWPRFVRSFGHLVAEIVEHVEAGHARAFPNKCTDDFRANSPATAGHNYTLVPHLHRLVILSGAASTARNFHHTRLPPPNKAPVRALHIWAAMAPSGCAWETQPRPGSRISTLIHPGMAATGSTIPDRKSTRYNS